MAGEKPYRAPAMPAAPVLTSHRRSTKNSAAADPAKPTVSSIERLTIGPAIRVTGVSKIDGSNVEVFHMALTPCGKFTAVVTSAGRWPCETAAAAYRRNQAFR